MAGILGRSGTLLIQFCRLSVLFEIVQYKSNTAQKRSRINRDSSLGQQAPQEIKRLHPRRNMLRLQLYLHAGLLDTEGFKYKHGHYLFGEDSGDSLGEGFVFDVCVGYEQERHILHVGGTRQRENLLFKGADHRHNEGFFALAL